MYTVTPKTPKKTLNLKATGIERVLQNISNLLTTVKGEIPLGRDIGISSEFIDKTMSDVDHLYRKEVIELINSKEPRAKVKSIEIEKNLQGQVYPKVEVIILE